MHLKGYVHGDIKPEKLIIGKDSNSNQIYLIGFGNSTKYTPKNGEHLPISYKHKYQGSLMFSSINSQRGFKLSRRDDLENFGYLLIYLLTGSLPWLLYTSVKDVCHCKMNTPVQYLCEGLPPEFEIYINSVKCLGYSDEPDYSYYRQLFKRLFIKEGYIYDYHYDWSTNSDCETKFCLSSLNAKTIPKTLMNSKELQLKNNTKEYSKSNIPPSSSIIQLSPHQTSVYYLMENKKNHHHPKKINTDINEINKLFKDCFILSASSTKYSIPLQESGKNNLYSANLSKRLLINHSNSHKIPSSQRSKQLIKLKEKIKDVS